MSAAPAAICLAACYLTGGFGLLGLAGAFKSGFWTRDALALVGVAYICGLACTSVVLIALLCLGLPLGIPELVAVSLGFAALGYWRSRQHVPQLERRAVSPSRLRRAEAWLAGVVIAGFTAYGILFFRFGASLPMVSSLDAWAMWVRKAELLYHFGSIPTQFFTSAAYAGTHPNYPLLIPMMNALWFHLTGFNPVSLHGQYWVLLMMAAGAIAWLASRLTRPGVWVPLIAALVVLPAIHAQLFTLEADIPLGLFLMVGVMALAFWLQAEAADEMRGLMLTIGIVCLAAAANTKDEGLTDAVVVVLGLWVFVLASRLIRRRRGLPKLDHSAKPLLIATLAFAVMVAPWLLWLAAHHLGGSDIPIAKGLDPGYVYGRRARAWPSVVSLYQAATAGTWIEILPIGFAVAAIGVLLRRTRKTACLYLVAGVGVFASLVWAYVISLIPLTWYLYTSTYRTVDDFMFIAIAGTIHLSGLILGNGQTRPVASPSDAEDDLALGVAGEHQLEALTSVT